MQAAQIRRLFLDFFVQRGHREVPSSPLVPAGDPTLLFTNAGMVQFKRTFLGLEQRDYLRAATSQKCVRAGGKHNDLEQVGHTDRHHTFFEMLGNFSFGDYFKRDAIQFAWEYVTSQDWLGIDPDRLRVSVHHKDAEARKLWHEVTGLPESRIYGLGDADNFWQMADTGPCGPCSEIYVDLEWEHAAPRRTHESMREFVEEAERGRFLEIWNLVFMQYDRQQGGELKPLPAPSVDTGAGLERIAAVMQGVRSNFHTDLFLPLIVRAERELGRRYGGVARRPDRLVETPPPLGPGDASFRVLADHARAVAFLLADGVYPGNEGRGYVLRRILRRAVRHAWLMERREATLVHLVDEVVKLMGGHYPELVKQAAHLADVTRAEEERFLETIEGGLERMEQLTAVSAEEAFKLYDTYGFPIDLTQIVAAERGISVDVAGFEALLDQQRERSRGARKIKMEPRSSTGAMRAGQPVVRTRRHEWTAVRRGKQHWIGYDTTQAPTTILRFARLGDRLGLVLHENPFYVESGGQVSDTGLVRGEGWELPVDDVQRVEWGTAVFGDLPGPFEPTPAVALVNEPRRRDTERNHTATHLLHAALRKVLGTHVRQAGSVVSPDYLRFDFTHHAPLGAEAVAAVEEEVNRHVWENLAVDRREMKYADALGLGAMALFGEKYGDVVRVITVPGVSVELCGGTHVLTTGQIGPLRLVSESGVGAGVRRVEALTGPGAFRWLLEQEQRLRQAAERLGSTPEHVARRVEQLAEENRRLGKRVEDLIKGGGSAGEAVAVGTTQVELIPSASSDRNEFGSHWDGFKKRHATNGIAVIWAAGDKPGIAVGVTDDLVRQGVQAPDLVNRLAAIAGGKGGGRPYFAQAGLAEPDKLEEVKGQALTIIAGVLEKSR